MNYKIMFDLIHLLPFKSDIFGDENTQNVFSVILKCTLFNP